MGTLLIVLLLFTCNSFAITKGDIVGYVRPSQRRVVAKQKEQRYLFLEIDECETAEQCQEIRAVKYCFQGSPIKNLDLMKVYCAFKL